MPERSPAQLLAVDIGNHQIKLGLITALGLVPVIGSRNIFLFEVIFQICVFAALALGAPDREVAFAVPTVNFGNILAAWAARLIGGGWGECIGIELLDIATCAPAGTQEDRIERGLVAVLRCVEPCQTYVMRGLRPVLHAGTIPSTNLGAWDFFVTGEVENPIRISWEEFSSLPRTSHTQDIHCVTRWSKFDTVWEGVAIQTILEIAQLRPEATHVIAHCEQGYTTNMPRSVLDDDDVTAFDVDVEILEDANDP